MTKMSRTIGWLVPAAFLALNLPAHAQDQASLEKTVKELQAEVAQLKAGQEAQKKEIAALKARKLTIPAFIKDGNPPRRPAVVLGKEGRSLCDKGEVMIGMGLGSGDKDIWAFCVTPTLK